MSSSRSFDRRSFVLGGAATAAGLGLAACGATGKAKPAVPRPIALRYGDGPFQSGDLWLSLSPGAAALPVVVLIHGNFWEAAVNRSELSPLASSIASRGWAAWNIDYRTLGHGGGWPNSYIDVAAGVDHLAKLSTGHNLDLDRVVVLGHCGGGTLALWAGGRSRLPVKAPGSRPVVHASAVFSLAGVNNLIAAVFEGLAGGVVARFVHEEPALNGMDDYTVASPVELLPFGIPQVLVYGTADAEIPVDQSVTYAAKARQFGDTVTLVRVAGAGHYDLIRPTTTGWSRTMAQLARLLES